MAAPTLTAYQQVHTTTAHPGDLVVQLYDGALRALRVALRALERDDRATYTTQVARANAIVGELSATLDRATGGEIAANLDHLYEFVLHRLNRALVERTRQPIDDVLRVLVTLREAFDAAVDAVGGRRS
jgi:flagellar secretion chaperone FliS